MENLKKQILYLGSIEKVQKYLVELINKDLFHFEQSEELPDYILDIASLIKLIIIDYHLWDFELHVLLKKLKAINPELKTILIFQDKCELLDNHLFYNDSYNKLLINHKNIIDDFKIIFKEYNISNNEFEEYLTINQLSLKSKVNIPIYAHAFNEENFLIRKPIFSNEIKYQKPQFKFNELKYSIDLSKNDIEMIENEDYLQFIGDFSEVVLRLKRLTDIKLPFLATHVISKSPSNFAKYTSIIESNYVGLSFKTDLENIDRVDFYIIECQDLCMHELKNFLHNLQEHQIALLLNFERKKEDIKINNVLVYDYPLSLETLKKVMTMLVDNYTYKYYFFPKEDTLKIGTCSIDLNIKEMSENHIVISLPFSIEIGSMIEFDLGFKVLGYLSICEKTADGYLLYFNLTSLPEEEQDFLRKNIHSLYYCLEKGVKPEAIKTFNDIELVLEQLRTIQVS
jgi:hypothetical protein